MSDLRKHIIVEHRYNVSKSYYRLVMFVTWFAVIFCVAVVLFAAYMVYDILFL